MAPSTSPYLQSMVPSRPRDESPGGSDASLDEDVGKNDAPFFSNAEMGLVKPVQDPKEEARALVDGETDRGLPTAYDFHLICYEYLSGLSHKKREKALLNGTMYHDCMAAIRNPKDTTLRTPQFRYWARKTFRVTPYHKDMILTTIDGKPVAARERILGVLKHCHLASQHGGRDKTSAEVRKFYAWIPKEIVAKYVQKCPTCQSKRTLSSASLGPMSDSQRFLVAEMNETNAKLDSKKTVTLAEAKAAAQTALAQRAQKRAEIGQGRVHLAGSSSVPPANAVHYPSSFGQPSYFNPSQSSLPYNVSRSVSFDATAQRQYLRPGHPDMTRRVSDSAAYYADPNPGQYYPAQGYSGSYTPEPHYTPVPTHTAGPTSTGHQLNDVHAACAAAAQPEPSFAEAPIDPDLVGQHDAGQYSAYHTGQPQEEVQDWAACQQGEPHQQGDWSEQLQTTYDPANDHSVNELYNHLTPVFDHAQFPPAQHASYPHGNIPSTNDYLGVPQFNGAASQPMSKSNSEEGYGQFELEEVEAEDEADDNEWGAVLSDTRGARPLDQVTYR